MAGFFTKKAIVRRSLIPAGKILSGRGSGSPGIFMYHRVTPINSALPESTLYVTPSRFRQQLEGLLELGFTAWSLPQLLRHHRDGLDLPASAFVVTFDDGYECIHRHAWPILKELRIPATIFLATKYLSSDNPFPFDDGAAAGSAEVPRESWRPLSIEQCMEMANCRLVDLGAHTHAHRDFREQPEDFKADLATCTQFMETRFNVRNPHFAFPFGYTNPRLLEILQESGLPCALTVEEQYVAQGTSPYNWGIFEASQADTASTLAICLHETYSFARNSWRRLRGARHG